MIDTNTQAWISKVQNNTVISDYHEDEEILLVSPHCVMHSAAGYYVGRVCTEWETHINKHDFWDSSNVIDTGEGYWVPQPYSRDTEYMAEEDAYRTLERWEQENPDSTMLSPVHRTTITAINTEETT